MRVPSRALWICACLLMLLPLASDVLVAGDAPTMSGLGMIDFRGKPRFKVGDWVKYHFSSKSDNGSSEDYDMTLLISGEEQFWGEDCFWLETWSGGRTLPAQRNAILMSYAVFGDTAWLNHIEVYQRKTSYLGEEGAITQELRRRLMVRGHATTDNRSSLTVIADTLGRDTVHVESGLYDCTKVARKAGLGSVEERGDSTMRMENWSRHTLYLTPRIPITSVVRQNYERWVTRKTWKIGKSAEAVSNYAMRGDGKLTLLGWGSGDLAPIVTPVNARGKSLRKTATQPAVPKPRKRG